MDPSAADAPVLVLTSVPPGEVGEALVDRLVQERLVACGSLLPDLRSVYRWDGQLQRDAEVLVILKTVRSCAERLFERIADLHPYEVPELIALPVVAAAEAYAAWLRRETIEVNA